MISPHWKNKPYSHSTRSCLRTAWGSWTLWWETEKIGSLYVWVERPNGCKTTLNQFRHENLNANLKTTVSWYKSHQPITKRLGTYLFKSEFRARIHTDRDTTSPQEKCLILEAASRADSSSDKRLSVTKQCLSRSKFSGRLIMTSYKSKNSDRKKFLSRKIITEKA
jgi:hypothetical protein